MAKLAPGGAITWATYLGGTGDDEANGIAVDAAGAAYITGGTASTNFPTANAYQGATAGGARDIFVSKLSPDGTKLVYSTYLGGSKDELGNGIAVDTEGNAYIGGSSSSTDFPSIAAFQGALKGEAENGPISVTDASGDVKLSAHNGPLAVKLAGTRWDGAGLQAEARSHGVRMDFRLGGSELQRLHADGLVVLEAELQALHAICACLNSRVDGPANQ